MIDKRALKNEELYKKSEANIKKNLDKINIKEVEKEHENLI